MRHRNIVLGIGCGVVATVSMTTVHRLAAAAGLFPVWLPVPMAVARKIFGSGIPEPLVPVLGIGCHLAYGSFWAIVLFTIARRVTIWKGISMGVFLWLVMQLGVLPFLGWGISGGSIKIAAATLVEHLVYGTMLGWLGARSRQPAATTQAEQLSSGGVA